MVSQLDKCLKDVFQPTPECFRKGVDGALANLPAHGGWKLKPAFAAVLASVAACALLVAVFSVAVRPAGPGSPAANRAHTQRTPGRLVQLRVSHPVELRAEDGWQAVAVAGEILWYYNPGKAQVARGEGGKYAAFSLNLPGGRAVESYSFQPDPQGQWVAFTVRGGKGDSVWVVTKSGRKMSVPEDVLWVDSLNDPVRADFSGAAMTLLEGEGYIAPSESENEPAPDSIAMLAEFPDGEAYRLDVSLNTKAGHADCLLDFRYGSYSPMQNRNMRMIATGVVAREENGRFVLRFYGERIPAELQSNRFSLFKAPGEDFLMRPSHALLIYADDAARILWELNLDTGKMEQVAAGCIAAGWVDDFTYWYVTQSGSTLVMRREAADARTVRQQAGMIGYTGEDNGKVTLYMALYFTMQNLTGEDIPLPQAVPCDLRLRKDGKTLWESGETLQFSDFEYCHIYPLEPDGEPRIGRQDEWPAVLRPGYALYCYNMKMTECVEPGVYTLEGSVNGKAVRCESTVGNHQALPEGVELQGEILQDGRLQVVMRNRSRATYTWNLSSSAYAPLSPVVCYRLLSSGKVVSEGRIVMAGKGLPSTAIRIHPGESLAMTGDGESPAFARLPAGRYTLECYLKSMPEQDDMYEKLPWGFGWGHYFDVPFTAKGE